MYLIETRFFRVISLIVLFFFSWTCGGLFDVAYAVKTSGKQSAISNQLKSKEQGPEAKLSKSIEDIGHILNEVSTDINTKKGKLKAKKTEVETFDKEIRKQFADTEKKLRDAGLPEKILKRHKYFVDKYDNNYNELRNNLDAIDGAADECQLNAEIEKTKIFLEKIKPPKRNKPLDPNNLPNRSAKPTKAKPRTKPEEFSGKQLAISDKLQEQIPPHPPLLKGGLKDGLQLTANSSELNEPILVASNSSLKGLLGAEKGKIESGEALLSSELPAFHDSELSNSSYSAEETSLSDYILLAQASDPPTSDDLAETIEVQFTPAITAKAAELGNDPVKIYNWVRNNIEFVPTYGSIQGADMCLQTKQCNAFDTSSLLIALLRVSNIHARYVEGTVEVPIDKVMNWVGGFTDKMSAINFIASGGIPVTGLTEGGEVVMVRMEHIWVEAWVDYTPSRGSRHIEGDIWIPLDASYKQYIFADGIDLQTAVPFDAQSFIDQTISTAIIDEAEGHATGVDSLYINQTMTDYQMQVEDYITQNYPDATVGDVIGKKEIVLEDYPYLLGTMPYRLIVTGQKMSEIPNNLRQVISIKLIKDIYDEIVGSPIDITRSLPEIAGKKITISYLPSTNADAMILTTYGYYETPPYLVTLKPVLFIDGERVAIGNDIGMGQVQELIISFSSPSGINDRINHLITTSSFVSIGLDTQRVSLEFLQKSKSKLELATNDLDIKEVRSDDIIGEILNLHSLTYFYMANIFNKLSTNGDVAYSKQTAEMITSLSPSVSYTFDTPYKIQQVGMQMDVQRFVTSQKSLDGNKDKERAFILSKGLISSALEHIVFEALHEGSKGMSALKALMIASELGIPVYKIDVTNSQSILPKLQVSPEILQDISNAINSEKEVIIPERNFQYNAWSGNGYIILDPETGAGTYMISGGLAGGSTTEEDDSVVDSLISILKESTLAAADVLVDILIELKALSRVLIAIKAVVGYIATAITGFLSALDMYNNTGSIWKGFGAFAVTVTVSLLAGLAIAWLIPGLGPFLAIVAIVAVIALAYLIETVLLDMIREASLLNFRQRFYVFKWTLIGNEVSI
jgi:hypothetical protein